MSNAQGDNQLACRRCGQPRPTSAAACPHCGAMVLRHRRPWVSIYELAIVATGLTCLGYGGACAIAGLGSLADPREAVGVIVVPGALGTAFTGGWLIRYTWRRYQARRNGVARARFPRHDESS